MTHFRGHMSDLLNHVSSNQFFVPEKMDICADFSLNYEECIEAYGIKRGYKLCKDYSDDFHECKFQTKQNQVAKILKRERRNKILEGKIKKDNRFGPKIEIDSFQEGPFY